MATLVGRAQNSQLYLFTGQTHSELFLYSRPMLPPLPTLHTLTLPAQAPPRPPDTGL